MLDLNRILALQQKPAPFEPGEPLFWDDPHISTQMLKAHLDPNSDLASRRPETIDRMVGWIADTLGLQAGDRVLDLGCGPGLYASRLSERGLIVTGVDYSRRSIAYARDYAEAHGLAIAYRYENYLELKDEKAYDAALLIYGDFCPLNPDQRSRLLANVRRALKPGGRFVLDVTTRTLRAKYGVEHGWYAVETGFWRPGPHLVLEEGFDYPEEKIYADQHIVIDPDGKVSVYRNWFQDYDPAMLTAELEAGGFEVEGLWGDLSGAPLTADSEWIGAVARSL
ncbi:MAG: class I SAM-dependent methyltransferase [Anaerolineaceae bacterium]|nr:class I SAM-dependent methyltransferase [Anaerolineaceae bacterium]